MIVVPRPEIIQPLDVVSSPFVCPSVHQQKSTGRIISQGEWPVEESDLLAVVGRSEVKEEAGVAGEGHQPSAMVGLKEDDNDNLRVKIGDRVCVGPDRGTVKYIGPVVKTTGIWLGIDWDNPSRGKHDGTHANIQYFRARYPTSGSLVRQEKVSFGRSIVEAIKDKYGGTGIDMDKSEIHEIEKATGAPFIEMVGFDSVAAKQKYSDLKIVSLREEQVNGPGMPGELKSLCPKIEELDLGKNLIKSWIDAAAISCQLNNLTFLDVSENMLSPNEATEELMNSFSNLDYLVLSRVDYSWNDVMNCAKMWPNIMKLQVSYNRITSLSAPPENIFFNLSQLSLEGNKILNWNEVLKLGLLQKLEILNISNTGISEITFPTPNMYFPALKYLLASGNRISDWSSINELNKLKSLCELRFRDNPVIGMIDKETARQILIARLPTIKILNGQGIVIEERRGSEYDYLKQEAKGWYESKYDPGARKKFNLMHPLYSNLVNRYGEIDKCEFEKKSSALKYRMVNVVLSCEGRTITRRIPVTMTVQKLCLMMNKLFNTHVSASNVVVISNANEDLKVPLDDEMKQLSFYSIEEGDIIQVVQRI